MCGSSDMRASFVAKRYQKILYTALPDLPRRVPRTKRVRRASPLGWVSRPAVVCAAVYLGGRGNDRRSVRLGVLRTHRPGVLRATGGARRFHPQDLRAPGLRAARAARARVRAIQLAKPPTPPEHRGAHDPRI